MPHNIVVEKFHGVEYIAGIQYHEMNVKTHCAIIQFDDGSCEWLYDVVAIHNLGSNRMLIYK